MPKTKSVYVCTSCGAESSKWIGKCPACNEWNTYQEYIVSKSNTQKRSELETSKSTPQKLGQIESTKSNRISTNIGEFDRILGGGLVPGSMVLIGGEPGIGKSTIALQTALLQNDFPVLYISGEESLQQIKLRANRIGLENDNLLLLNETVIEDILVHIENVKPGLIVLDSIQTMITQSLESAPGTVSQVRESTIVLLKVIKEKNIPTLLIGHINKDGNIAGPKVLEHIVDVVIQFDGDQNNFFRLMRTSKNRFGSTSELGVFEMNDKGLKEILNPSEYLINREDEKQSGSSIASIVNGARPMLIEIQALVSTAAYGTPQRTANGFDNKRLNMLLAVLEKRAGFNLSNKDVFLNLVGGIKIDDPSLDLAVVTSILSSNFDKAIDKNLCFAGEIGLSGEIRPVSRIDQRIKESEKLGFKKILVPGKHEIKNQQFNIAIEKVNKIEDLLKKIFHS